MKNVGFIGWRGMVGSVLMQRMVEERDFDAIRPVFFSTSQLGQAAPSFGGTTGTLQDAFIPTKSIQSFVKADGKVTGLTQHRLCA